MTRGVRSFFGPTRKSSPWGNFSDGGLNQSIERRLSLETFIIWLVHWSRTARSVFTGAGLKSPNTAGHYSKWFIMKNNDLVAIWWNDKVVMQWDEWTRSLLKEGEERLDLQPSRDWSSLLPWPMFIIEVARRIPFDEPDWRKWMKWTRCFLGTVRYGKWYCLDKFWLNFHEQGSTQF